MVYIASARRRVPMPWKETSAMDQRIQLIADWLSGDYRKSELCRSYGISRPTGDKWIRRYDQHGLQGLAELERAPHRHPNQTAEELRALIVQTKLRRQKWGPKKVLDWVLHLKLFQLAICHLRTVLCHEGITGPTISWA